VQDSEELRRAGIMSRQELADKQAALMRKTAEIAAWADRQHVAEEQVWRRARVLCHDRRMKWMSVRVSIFTTLSHRADRQFESGNASACMPVPYAKAHLALARSIKEKRWKTWSAFYRRGLMGVSLLRVHFLSRLISSKTSSPKWYV
jgi:hypothetical protein